MDIAHARRHASEVVKAVGEELFGLESVIKLSLAALFSGGHVLLEGNPGLGKTELVKMLARVMNLKAGRIQFTPDLMPADITGTLMPTGQGGLRFQSGPIFTSLLLADEINRATPKRSPSSGRSTRSRRRSSCSPRRIPSITRARTTSRLRRPIGSCSRSACRCPTVSR
jgi:energy-coupling factor transporter ATP-binding protein EcfA2